MGQKYSILTVVIPAYNEEDSIQKTIREVKRVLRGSKIIVVDDGSTDATRMLARKEHVNVVVHQKNRGYMAALATGMVKAKTFYVGIMDADMTYYPSYFIPMLNAVKKKKLGCSWGNRFGGSRNEMPLVRKIGNHILNIVFFMVTGRYVKDCACGQRVFTKTAIRKLDVSTLPRGLDGITALSKRIVARKIQFEIVSMSYGMREGSSKLSIVKHFILMVRNIMRER
jgi:glycosyltransferase involved in cell wall biosynthesis